MGLVMQIAFLADPAYGMAPYRPLVTLTMGPDFVQTGYAQTRALLPPFQNHYTATHSQQTVTDIGIFLGVERMITAWLTTDLGISGYIDNTLSPQGEVWQFAVPAYDTLGYQYHIYNKRVVFTNKLFTMMPPYQALHPYFSWEAGIAFNNAKDYGEYPLVALATPTAPFANHSQHSFTWAVGMGIDYDMTAHLRAGAGYQFADLGSASLGETTASTTTQTLSIPHLYTNQLHFQVTFLA
jgi:hypothetical protein